jgi:hypothetical protein
MSTALMTTRELEPTLPRGAEGLSFDRLQVKTGSCAGQFGGGLRGAIRSAPIWHVRRRQRCFQLVQPLMVRVRQDEDFFFAENETLRIVGTGTNPQEALVDFSMHLMHFHQYYTRISADQLTGEAKRLKELFQSIFVEEG